MQEEKGAHAVAKKRVESIDVAKGIAMLCIIIGHVTYRAIDGTELTAPLVFQFHVPVFFIVAGYFINKKRSIGQFIRQKAWRLLAPYVLTCVVLFVVVAVMIEVQGESQPPTVFRSRSEVLFAALWGNGSPMEPGGTLIGAIWFLEALFIGLVEVRVLIRFERVAPFVVVALAIAAVLTVSIYRLPCNIQPGLLAGFYIYLGYVFKKVDLFSRKWHPAVFVLALLATIAVYVVCVVYRIFPNVVNTDPGPHWLGIPASISASLMVIMVSHLIARYVKPLRVLFEFYGKNSMPVLCMHLILLDLGLEYILSTYGFVDDPVKFAVNLCVQVAVCSAIVPVAKYTPGLKKIFY